MLTETMLITMNGQFAGIKNLLSTMSLLFKNYALVEVVYLLIKFNKSSSSCETQTVLMEMVYINKIHTHTDHSERHHWKGFVSMKTCETHPFLK